MQPTIDVLHAASLGPINSDMTMANRNDKHRRNSRMKNRPYCIVGADRLSAAIWKYGDEEGGFRYQFNIFRMLAAHGRVSQLFGPEDVVCLAKLAHILAVALLDDGCIDADTKGSLRRLSVRLDTALTGEGDHEHRLELVPIDESVMSAIQYMSNYHSYIDKEGFEDSVDAAYLMARVEEVQEWLRGLGYESTISVRPKGESSH